MIETLLRSSAATAVRRPDGTWRIFQPSSIPKSNEHFFTTVTAQIAAMRACGLPIKTRKAAICEAICGKWAGFDSAGPARPKLRCNGCGSRVRVFDVIAEVGDG